MENTTYTTDEAFEASLNYFGGDELAARVWVSKYALKDSYGNLYEKTPADMHCRLAGEIARIEKNYPDPMSEQEIFDLLDKFRYIVPQGSPMTGIGNEHQIASLSNCFVIGLDGKPDSYGGVIKIDEEQVQLMKRRGGVGHDLSHIRPKGTPVKNSALTSTGLVPFMERYSNSTREVAQDGRRGALMLSVSVVYNFFPQGFCIGIADNLGIFSVNGVLLPVCRAGNGGFHEFVVKAHRHVCSGDFAFGHFSIDEGFGIGVFYADAEHQRPASAILSHLAGGV